MLGHVEIDRQTVIGTRSAGLPALSYSFLTRLPESTRQPDPSTQHRNFRIGQFDERLLAAFHTGKAFALSPGSTVRLLRMYLQDFRVLAAVPWPCAIRQIRVLQS